MPREFCYPKVTPVHRPSAADVVRHARQRELVIASLLAQPIRTTRGTPGRATWHSS